MTEAKFICTHCGKSIQSLYKRYSSTVLKLTQCERCNSIADKYVEYDLTIIIIDLILLRIVAYRHILLNSGFKNFWKLSVILLLLESYSKWALLNKDLLKPELNDTQPHLFESDIYLDDFRFYKICSQVALNSLIFVIAIYSFTRLYTKFKNKDHISFLLVWKTITLSSFGMFFTLPTLIWDISKHDVHINFILFYTILSQLLAYTALCDCPKIWSVIVIFSSYIFRLCTFNLNFLFQ